MSPVLSAKGASFRWKDRELVRSASLDIEPGKVTVVIGPNGAGKSTLLRMMSGELRPSSGAVYCEGQCLDALSPWLLARRRAVMAQTMDVVFPFTALEVVRLGLESLMKAFPARVQHEALERSLRAAEAERFAGQRYSSLSGGEKRRVQFARALVQLEAGRSDGAAQALLLDEPVANLDPYHQLKLLDEARRLASEGVGVLAILHDLNLAARYADSLVVMRSGAIVAQGARDGVLTSELLSQAFDMPLSISANHTAGGALVLPSEWISPR